MADRGSTALLTDHYELTMLAASLRDGMAHRPAVFEVFARSLPRGRRYGVFAGLGRLLDAIDDFKFGRDELSFLRRRGFLDEATLEFLDGYRFEGDVVSYREGEVYVPWSPVLTVEASFAEAVLLETLILSILNHDTAVASAASRMVGAADGRRLLEMGGRRTHEFAAVAAARAAFVAGFDATSNLEASRRYGIPTAGTAAHAFTLAHDDERAAFASQLDALGVGTTLLVDTYDIPTAIRTAVDLARGRGATGPGAIRIDSGDLVDETRRARALLDELGAYDTRIVVSGDLDEYVIEELVECRAPIDSFGVGTRVVSGSGHPTASFVYKLVAIDGRPVAKRSAGKATVGGRKRAWRDVVDGTARAEHVAAWPERFDEADEHDGRHGRPLQVLAIRGGRRLHDPSNDDIRARHRESVAELDHMARMTVAGEPAFVVTDPTISPASEEEHP
ncbi:MAG TPA: nicotinate phosphoribosyltransferase [Acidimicrobiales bacterium]|nr:nicotinate phosphoribosyltransferase [Acidimicrobiales bacterium]